MKHPQNRLRNSRSRRRAKSRKGRLPRPRSLQEVSSIDWHLYGVLAHWKTGEEESSYLEALEEVYSTRPDDVINCLF